MSQREKFEASWRKEYPLHGATTFKRSGFNPDAYVNTRVHDGWLMWQASRRAALEEAAQVAYAHNAIMATTTAQLIENAIRALAKEANNG